MEGNRTAGDRVVHRRGPHAGVVRLRTGKIDLVGRQDAVHQVVDVDRVHLDVVRTRPGAVAGELLTANSS